MARWFDEGDTKPDEYGRLPVEVEVVTEEEGKRSHTYEIRVTPSELVFITEYQRIIADLITPKANSRLEAVNQRKVQIALGKLNATLATIVGEVLPSDVDIKIVTVTPPSLLTSGEVARVKLTEAG
ncbi:hypothetical protein [Bacteriophage sp.]|nr:hypothetical protein [Bacteriophage sp.]UOF80142.1 hypothetical protein [Bacteriophage sp.]